MENCMAIVLAAGKGTRLNAKKINKVMYPLAGKPMISYTANLLLKVGIKNVIIVVGFLKQSIINFLGKKYVYVTQLKRLGTAHAVKTTLPFIPKNIDNVLVLHADDSAFYPAKVIKGLILKHIKDNADLTFLTVKMKNPDIARVVRNRKGKVIGVVELQNMKPEHKSLKEINCGCYCFKKSFLKTYIPKVKKDSVSGEYYLPKLIELGIKYKKKVITFIMDKEDYFQSINTKKQLQKADLKMKKTIKT